MYDSGEHDGIPFIVMERLPGGTLADQIALGPVAEPCVRMMLDGTLAALAVAHANGVLHRDIKPGNILHTFDGKHYKVGDFGIAKTPGGALTVTGQIFGTIAYLSPDRLCGAQASAADDLYAVGIVGYEALTGRRAFGPDDNVGALTHAVLWGDRVPLQVLRPDVDPALAAVVERAMARDPRQRFVSAEAMSAALAGPQFVGRRAAPALRPPTKVLEEPLVPPTYVPPLPLLRSTSRRKRMLAAAAVLVAFAVTAFAFALDGSSSQPAPTPISTSPSLSAPATSSQLPPPTTSVVEQPLPDEPQGNGHGDGNGKKDGKGKGPKH